MVARHEARNHFPVRSVAAAARVSAASSPAAPPLLVARLADVDLPATNIATVQLRDGPARLTRRAHLDESEATRTAGVAVGDDRGRLARPHLREQRLELRAGGRK